jgi:PAS domain S-box-containing protein
MATANPTQFSERGVPRTEILVTLSRLHRLVFLADAEHRIVWTSAGLSKACGGGDRYLGRELHDLLLDLTPRPSRSSSSPCEADRPQDSDARVEGRATLIDADSKPSPVDVCLFRLPESTAHSARLIGVLRPADSSHAQVCEPRTTTDFFASILDNAPDAVIALDLSGFIVYVNRALEGITGRRSADLINQPVITLLSQTTSLEQTLALFDATGELSGKKLEFRDTNGNLACVSISSRALQLPDGRVAGNVCFLRDITEKTVIQGQLERKNAELESYVHSVSHDLRSPLVSLLGFSRLLREDYGHLLDDTGSHFLDRIEQAGRTMEALIHDLLELSRIGRPGENPTLVDPRAVILQLQAELKLRLDELGIALEVPKTPPLVYCDRTRLYQVLSNLIGNAINHMGPCPDPRIVIEVLEHKDCHEAIVRDSGKGIAPEDQERIFEVFTSIGRPADANAGASTGIGLAIVRKIVQTHKGRVWVESKPGHGASFHFTLPRH